MDAEADSPFDRYLPEIDDTFAEVQKTQRAEVAHREDDPESGFTAMLPLDALRSCDLLTLPGIRSDNSRDSICRISRSNKGTPIRQVVLLKDAKIAHFVTKLTQSDKKKHDIMNKILAEQGFQCS